MSETEGEVDQTSVADEESTKIATERKRSKQGAKSQPKKSTSKSSKESAQDEGNFAPKNQQLFLVEFLIDTVRFNSESLSQEAMEGQTCITLKFLNFPPMNVCEKDFDPTRENGNDKVLFNMGKSLMFAFAEKQCEEPPPMMVELAVSKKTSEDSPLAKVDIGVIKICMAQLFQDVYQVAKSTPDKLPASRSIKDCYMIIGKGKRTTGEVGVYIRLTCLGQNVVTEFQCGPNLGQDPIFFKNRDAKKVYQFTGTEKPDEDECEVLSIFKEGCGCLGPPPTRHPGGQGDARRMPRRTSGGGAFTKGSRVVLDIPDKSKVRGGRNKTASKDRKVEGPAEKPKDLGTDPDHNCFVLKVGDKGQIPDRGKMILELRTPKQKILPKILPPYHEDIGVQTDSPKKSKGKVKKK